MVSRAYILIEATVGKSRDVAKSLQSIQGVRESYLVTGPYDLVALVEGTDANHISAIVTNHIHKIPGIARTITCLNITM